MLRCKSFLVRVVRHMCNYEKVSLLAEQLESRALIRVSGNSAADYLQGLVTNDVRHLEKNGSCMFAMFLNTKGRVLFDSIIYSGAQNEFFIECDRNVQKDLESHLKMFKVRRKISIDDVQDRFSLWTVNYQKVVEEIMNNDNPKLLPNNHRILTDLLQTSTLQHSFNDPRTIALGARVFVLRGSNLIELLKNMNINATERYFYQSLRYKLGIGEGANELPKGIALPLEANCDYLHGISFHKGCYIGQELTARTYHTGVVRKRIMPLQFQHNESLKFHSPVTVDSQERPAGKFLSKVGKIGIGLLRIEEVLKGNVITIDKLLCKTYRPFWWPTEAPKERPT